MKKIYENLNYELLTAPTGDPFVDAAGFALAEFSSHFQDLDILELIMKATDIYVDKWNSKINQFFLNSKITQPSFNDSKKKEETYEYFKSLLDESAPHEYGICRISSNKTALFPVGRDNSCLSGSSKFVNFHHSFERGLMLSKEMIIRFHFLPFACQQLEAKLSFIISNLDDVTEFFARNNCCENLKNIGLNLSTGVLPSESKSVGTAIFRQIDRILMSTKSISEDKNVSLSLYLFSNFATKPELEIYNLPFTAFSFYRFTQKLQYKQCWNKFVSHYYSDSKSTKYKYDTNTNTFIDTGKNGNESICEGVFKNWRNIIYDNIINGKSILGLIHQFCKNNYFNFDIVKVYLIKLRNMKKETIQKIEQIADYVLDSNDQDGVEKALQKLNKANSSHLLRRFLLKDIVAKYYNEGNKEAIIKLDDYTNYLFTDSSSWMEIRDVLIIAIYQKLHEKNIYFEQDIEQDIEQDLIEEN